LSTINTHIAHVPLNSKSFVFDNFFCIDLNKCSDLRQDMKETIKRIKKQNFVEESELNEND